MIASATSVSTIDTMRVTVSVRLPSGRVSAT
jgi:hypothetical protein